MKDFTMETWQREWYFLDKGRYTFRYTNKHKKRKAIH